MSNAPRFTMAALVAVAGFSLTGASPGLLVAKARAGDNDFQADLAKQAEAARKGYEAADIECQAGVDRHLEVVYTWSKRWMEAELQQYDEPDKKLAAAEAHLKRMTRMNELNHAVVDPASGSRVTPVQYTEYYVAEAQCIYDRLRRATRSK